MVLPSINIAGAYAHASNLDQHGGGLAAGLSMKVLTIVLLFAPTGFLALRSPLAIVLLPTLAWRMVSGNPGYWGPGFHYSAVLMPIVFIAAVDGFTRLESRRLAYRWVPVCALTIGVCSLVIQSLQFAHSVWSPAQQRTVAETIASIPDGATVAASNNLAPHLTSRCRVLLFPRYPAGPTQPEWVILARPQAPWPIPPRAQEEIAANLTQRNYIRVVATTTILLLRRVSTPP